LDKKIIKRGVYDMKDLLLMCAKIALGLFIGFTIIFGGSNSLDKKAETVLSGAGTAINDKISYDTSSSN
jgi:hypothetical protein